jgi:hypothetical protein
VAYWARGVDIHVLAAEIREAILDTSVDIDENVFFDILQEGFEPLTGIGHFWFWNTFNLYNIPYIASPMDRINFEFVYNSPAARRFYEPRIESIFDYSMDDVMADFIDFLTNDEIGQKFLEYSLGGNFENLNKFESLDELRLEVNRFMMKHAENVRTEIIEDGKIAYLSMATFMPTINDIEDRRRVFDFYDEIADFEHLIIDLRGNGGGFFEAYLNLFMAVNISEIIRVPAFYFFMDGEYTRRFSPYVTRTPLPIAAATFTNMNPRPIEDILAEHQLVDLRIDDMERLSYGVVGEIRINEQRLPRFNNQPAFNSNIWLLTDEHMGSAAQIAAWVSKDSGFATLVGEVTGGNYGGQRTVAVLPNSGIAFQFDLFYATDRHGRPIEAGTVPHHFNRPGMDALQTVLALIEEGEY